MRQAAITIFLLGPQWVAYSYDLMTTHDRCLPPSTQRNNPGLVTPTETRALLTAARQCRLTSVWRRVHAHGHAPAMTPEDASRLVTLSATRTALRTLRPGSACDSSKSRKRGRQTGVPQLSPYRRQEHDTEIQYRPPMPPKPMGQLG